MRVPATAAIMRAMRLAASSAVLAIVLAGACREPSSTTAGRNVRPLENPAPAGAAQPQLVAGDGRVLLSWVEPGGPASGPALRFAEWRGERWDATRTASTDPALLTNPVEIPAVVPLAAGGLAAAWVARRSGGEYASEVRVSVSVDGGLQWSPPRTVHGDGTPTPHGLLALAPSPSGGFEIAWLDGRAESDPSSGAATRLYAASWDPAGFGPEELVDPRVCDCCKTALAAVPGGFVLAYRDRGDDDVRDISAARRDAARWSAPVPLPPDGWRLSACPTNGPAIASRDGRVAVAWFTGAGGGHVRVAFSADGGVTFGSAASLETGIPLGRVDVSLLPGGDAAVVWLERDAAAGARVVVRRVAPSGVAAPPVVVASTSAGRASGFPRVAAVRDGMALVAWTDAAVSPSRVRVAAVGL